MGCFKSCLSPKPSLYTNPKATEISHTQKSNQNIENHDISSKELENSQIIPINNHNNDFPVPLNKVRLKDFKLHKVLGKGGFGKVLLVEKKDSGHIYAMKILDKHFIKKKQQKQHTETERLILSKIVNPFVIQLFYAFQTSEKLYLVTEFAQGGELFFHLRREYHFPEERVIFYAAELVLALEDLHKNGVIYRDLKPENVLLDNKGNLKICDFGLSKIFLKKEGEDEKANTFCGTFEYLAPEILLGYPYDDSVDWWSLGVLVHEMLTGFVPFEKSEMINICQNQKTPEIKECPQSNPTNLDFISKLLEYNPQKRAEFAKTIKSHKFFESINWQDLLALKIEPPFQPKINETIDVRNFDTVFTEEKIKESVEPKSMVGSVEMYSNFSYAQDRRQNIS